MRLLVLLTAALVPTAAGAVEPVVAVATEGEAIVVDGSIDEAAWGRAPVVDTWWGIDPTEGFPPAGRTEARLLYEDRYLYVSYRCRFDEPTPVRGFLAEREDVNRDDQVGLWIDPFGDGRRAYVFYVNALGVQQDAIVSGDGWNAGWDAVFRSRGRIVEGGFDVELAVPFRSLRFDPRSEQPWRVMITRRFAARGEKVSHPRVYSERGNHRLQFAPLLGPQPKRSGVGLELLPTVVARTGLDRGDSGLRWREPGFPETVDPSIGVKWQTTPSLTLDATFNPDFSQIEADPDYIDNNLRFALQLDERRPFFVEGSELFADDMLYSRSIRDPLYGVKFSGKQGPIAVALLHALDMQPAASLLWERETPGFGEADVEGAVALDSHAGVAVDLGQHSRVRAVYSDKELLRDGAHHASYHGLKLDTSLSPDSKKGLWFSAALSNTGLEDGERLTGPLLKGGVWDGDRFWSAYAGTAWTHAGYRAENAYLAQAARWEWWSGGSRSFEPERGALRRVTFRGGAGGQLLSETLDVESAWIWGKAEARLGRATDLSLSTDYSDQLYEGLDFHGGSVSLAVQDRSLGWLQGEASGFLKRGIRYSNATQANGRGFSVQVDLRALQRLQVSLSTEANWLDAPGQLRDRLWLYRVRAQLGIVRSLSLRFIAQGREFRQRDAAGDPLDRGSALDLSLLLSFVPHAGTAIYVGWGQRLDLLGGPRVDSLDLFLKGSLLIRI